MTSNFYDPSRLNRAFTGIPTFLRSNYCSDLSQLSAKAAIYGVPFDEGSPFLPGTRFGPRSLREHSLRFSPDGWQDMETGHHYLADAVRTGKIVDVGDVDIASTNVELTFENITSLVRGILDRGVMPVGLGGDHSITYPIVRAFNQPLHVVQFDAHLDYDTFEGGLRHTNGHAFRHIHGMPNVQSLTQIGIRSLRGEPAILREVKANGGNVVPVGEYRREGAEAIIGRLPKDAPVYVSIDIDALDMSLVPGCVSGEPNGFTYEELSRGLAALAKHTNVVGFDFVEVNPSLDVGTGATSYLGTHIVVEFLGRLLG